MKVRMHSEPLPKGVERVISLFKRVMQLPNVLRVEVTPEEFVVSRSMDNDEEPVVPQTETKAEVDAEFLLAKIKLVELSFEPSSHPYLNLAQATQSLTDDRLRICGLVAPHGDTFADFFGLAEGTMPATFLGMTVSYVEDSKDPLKLLVLGGPTIYFNDATHGIIIDMGV